MKGHAVLGCCLSLFALSGCGTYGHLPAGEVTAAEAGKGGRWSAALSPPPALAGAMAITGWAAMVPDSGSLNTIVTLSLSDAAPGSVQRWSVNLGQCGTDGGVFGPAAVYGPIRIDNFGRARASARVPLRTPVAGNYFVMVRAPAASGELTVACGNFVPPTPTK